MYFEINGSEFTAPFRMAAAVKCTEFEKLEAPLVKNTSNSALSLAFINDN